uniref:Uncharacterized protein n=1 Tax=Anguilla anguilla TaxID=7936 RepID=A0A0E9UH74_ANGAN
MLACTQVKGCSVR